MSSSRVVVDHNHGYPNNSASKKFNHKLSSLITEQCEHQSNEDNYASSIEKLNLLQTNAQYIKNASFMKKSFSLEKTKYFLSLLNIKPNDLNRLNVIHVAGTKGKGSTCAFLESILRTNGFKTGFYSSPHLVVVRERIRINGKPIDEERFSRYFEHIFRQIENAEDNFYGMPGYFNFLTVMAFHIFLEEHVDVAIMEVGIGGELDCTNVIPKPIVTGVTSLDYDHCKMLGNTIEDIARQKAGIFKEGVPALTVPQSENALNVLKETADLVKAPFYIVPPWSFYPDSSRINLGIKGEVQKLNASLAVQLANLWINRMNNNKIVCTYLTNEGCFLDAIPLCQNNFATGLANTIWHGRCEIIPKGSVMYFLDAAHTKDSMMNCSQWFIQNQPNHSDSIRRVLVFNCTGERDPEPLLSQLSQIKFDLAIFTTNRVHNVKKLSSEQSNFTVTITKEDEIRMNNCHVWMKLYPNVKSMQVDCIAMAIGQIESYGKMVVPSHVHVLVCGSVHLVGGFIGLLHPDFIQNEC